MYLVGINRMFVYFPRTFYLKFKTEEYFIPMCIRLCIPDSILAIPERVINIPSPQTGQDQNSHKWRPRLVGSIFLRKPLLKSCQKMSKYLPYADKSFLITLKHFDTFMHFDDSFILGCEYK